MPLLRRRRSITHAQKNHDAVRLSGTAKNRDNRRSRRFSTALGLIVINRMSTPKQRAACEVNIGSRGLPAVPASPENALIRWNPALHRAVHAGLEEADLG